MISISLLEILAIVAGGDAVLSGDDRCFSGDDRSKGDRRLLRK